MAITSRQLGKGIVAGLAAACLLLGGCGGGSKTNVVSISLFPQSPLLLVNQTLQFTATVTGATDTTATWALTFTTSSNTTAQTCPVPPAVTTCGTIDTTGFYQAPAIVPNPAQTITVKATSNADSKKSASTTITLDSGIRVTVTPFTATIGTLESFQYKAILTNDATLNDVTWLATQDTAPSATSTACSASVCGSVDASGLYTAPATVPTTATVTILAISKLDTTRFGQASATVVTAAPVSFTGISPTHVPQGALQYDVYLQAANLRSTVVINVTINGVSASFSGDQIMFISPSTVASNVAVARIRLSAAQLSPAGPFPVTVSIAISGATGGPFSLTIDPVRPSLAHAIPDSTTQTSLALPVESAIKLNGGYFGTTSAKAVDILFDGTGNFVLQSPVDPRQIQLTTSAGALSTPGMYQFSLRNNSGAVGVAAANIAVQPDPNQTAPSFLSALPVGNAPSAIAIDTTLGTAIVANKGDNSVQRITVNGASTALLGGAIALPDGPAPPPPATAPPAAPVGVAVDEVRHFAAVANSTGQSVSIVNLQTGTLLSTIDLSGLKTVPPPPAPPAVPPPPATGLPAAVALEPNSGLGLVAFSLSSVGAIFNYDAAATPACLLGTAPYCLTGVVTLSSGVEPHIAFEPRLHWGIVTPGGAGVLSVVDVGRQMMNSTIAASPGAKRTGNVVTITTTASHNLDTSNSATVLITGVPAGTSGTDFNGAFAVTSVIDSKTFTYAQTASDDTSGGGQVNFSAPLLSLLPAGDANLRGISINPLTQTALLTDPNSSSGFFFSTLNQNVTSFGFSNGGAPEIGATGAGFQPFTNTAISVNPTRNEISLIDPVTPKRLTTLSTGGTGSGAVAVDPGTNVALVANSASNNVSVISLGSIKSVQVSGFQFADSARQFTPQTTLTSSSAVDLKIFGGNFTGSPQVRLDGVVVGPGTVPPASGGREVDITIPASFLTAPRRYALDVLNAGNLSNATDFTVVGALDMTAACPGTNPIPSGVAIDDVRELAVVANAGCNNISLIDLATMTAQTIAVGTAPTGVDVIPRLGLAAVVNSNTVVDPLSPNYGNTLGAGTVSIIDLVAKSQTASVTVGNRPGGVAIDQDDAVALVVSTGTNTLSSIDMTVSSPTAVSTATNQQPLSVAYDPDHRIVLVGTLSSSSGSGLLDVISLSAASVPTETGTISASPTIPTGVVHDPVSGNFIAVASLSNQLIVADATTKSAASVSVGVNPTSLAYNYNTGLLVTVNSQSNTISLVDAQTLRTIATLPIGKPPQIFIAGSSNPQFAIAIHPRTNLAVIADQYNHVVLFYPLP